MNIDKQSPTIKIPTSHQEVREKEWKSLQNGVLTTEGVQPCTLVALYDPGSRAGYLGHFTITLHQEDEGFVDMVETARTKHSGSQLEAWVGGAALIKTFGTGSSKANRVIYNEMVQANRDYVRDTLKKLDSKLTQDWLDYESQIVELAFDTTAGTITYSITQFEEP